MKFFLLLLFFFSLFSCAKLPVSSVQYAEEKKIVVGAGPEDMVLDTFSLSGSRLLISCQGRRKKDAQFAEIVSLDIESEKKQILPRKNNPPDLVFHPHGIDLVKNDKGELLLYCISHNDDKKEQSIVIYQVFADYLQFVKKLDSPLLVSPNDLAATSSGEIFVTNDAGKRGSVKEQLFKLKRGTVVKYDPLTSEWAVFADKLFYANGVAITKQNELLVSTIRQNVLFSYSIDNPIKRKTLAKLFGLDNISFVNQNEILVTSHPSLFKFLRHLSSSSHYSPSVVYRVNIISGEAKVVYSNDGSVISAASTAILYKDHLYISQVFEPFILKCKR